MTWIILPGRTEWGKESTFLAKGIAGKGKSFHAKVHIGKQKWQDKASPKP